MSAAPRNITRRRAFPTDAGRPRAGRVRRAQGRREAGAGAERPRWQHVHDAWKAALRGLHDRTYFNTAAGVDQRGRELVSHVIELVYEWRLQRRFGDVFPTCAALLDQVILKDAV